LKTNIDTYSGSSKLNILDIKQRKIYTEELRELFMQLRKLVDNKLDKVMMIFQFTHPSDYKLYEEARNSMPKRHVKKSNGEVTDEEAGILTGMVTDKADEMPIAAATVKLSGTDYTTETETETDSDGEYTFDSLPAGTYTIEVTLLDYQTATLTNQAVVAGDETVADFEMVKAV
jgi:protocatechuate 3,4-dioxygenase beta subunit